MQLSVVTKSIKIKENISKYQFAQNKTNQSKEKQSKTKQNKTNKAKSKHKNECICMAYNYLEGIACFIISTIHLRVPPLRRT